ncbi:MAG TPA: hypothetical protein DCG49_07940 [Ruminococcus sp.]|nr:hypothetical protein [Ruminococcus sp.]
MEDLTSDVILHQLRKAPVRGMIAAGIFFLLAAAGAIVSLFMRGYLDILTLIAAGAAAVALICLLVAAYKWLFVRSCPVVQRFGDAVSLAGCIRAGSTFAIWKTPPSRKYPLLITEEYVVCPAKVQTYLPLTEITAVQRCKMSSAGFLRRLCKAHSLSAAAAVCAGSAKERAFRKRNPLPDSEVFDMLCIWDQKKRQQHYFVSLADFNTVMAFLREYLPEAEFKPDKNI